MSNHKLAMMVVVVVAGFQGFHSAGKDPVKFPVAIDSQELYKLCIDDSVCLINLIKKE